MLIRSSLCYTIIKRVTLIKGLLRFYYIFLSDFCTDMPEDGLRTGRNI